MAASKQNKSPLEVLKETFGHTDFREGQLETITNILSGNSTLSVFPTGAGKSLCYQIPALLMEGKISIIISPLLSLIRDQLHQLRELHVSADTLNSSQTVEERKEVIEKLENGELTMLFLAPESLLKRDYQPLLKSLNIGIIAVDEAHCISEWGNSFRPSYLLAANAIRRLKPHAVLALTATATKEVARDIRSRFKIKTKDHIQNPLFRSNLHFRIYPCLSEHRNLTLTKLLNEPENLPAIVYVMKQVDAESVCGHLQANGIQARSYHAGMNSEARKTIQDGFIGGKVQIVVATIAFGMGVNKADIRSVVHYHLPKSPEGWIQESGRAGRDGKTSHCYLLGCGDDLIPLTNFVQGNEISKNAITRIVESIFTQGKEISISKYHLSQLNDTSDAQLDIILSYLMSEGHILPGETSHRYLQISRLRYTTQDYGRSKQALSQAIFEHWGRIDTKQAEELFKVSNSKLVNFILEMEELGDIAVKKTGLLHHYSLKKPCENTEQIVDAIHTNFTSYKENAVKRLDAVISAATTRSCIPARLIKYFGETLDEPCGTCSSCIGEKRARRLPSSPIPAVTSDDMQIIKTSYEAHQATLSTASRLARFCCGIMSPAIRHSRLYQSAEYGSLSHLPYAEVVAACKASISG